MTGTFGNVSLHATSTWISLELLDYGHRYRAKEDPHDILLEYINGFWPWKVPR